MNRIKMINEDLETTCVRLWKTSFYDCTTKRWVNGVLKLFPNSVSFAEETYCDGDQKKSHKNEKTLKLDIPFTIIRSVNKSSSSFIFPALTISTAKNMKYWFSSLVNREDTLSFLEHFLHPYLVNKEPEYVVTHHEDSKEASSMGKELLRSVVDSKKQLSEAGNLLVEQGQQLRNASATMTDLHNDLGVASRITRGLKSWLPKWKIPKSYEKEDFCVLRKNDVPDCYFTEALFYNVSPNVDKMQTQSIVLVEKDGISIFDTNQTILQHFKWSDISRVQVISLWEISISQFHLGKPDRKCCLVSVNMHFLMRKLEKYQPNVIEYITPELESAWLHFKHQDKKLSMKAYTKKSYQHDPTSRDEEGEIGLVHTTIPTEQEMTNLSKELTGLKCLALDIQKVEDEQLKEIDKLTNSVTQGADRLSKLNKTLKQL